MELDQDLKEIIPKMNYQSEQIAAQSKLNAIAIMEERKNNKLMEQLNTNIRSLEKTMTDLDIKNGVLQSKLFWLTVATVVLAIVQVIAAVTSLF